MILKRIKVNTGLIEETNCYIIQDQETMESIVIDPGGEADKIIEKEAEEIEPNFYIAEGRPVRLFERTQFDKYFGCFEKVQLNEIETTRWGNKKYMWEFIYKK